MYSVQEVGITCRARLATTCVAQKRSLLTGDENAPWCGGLDEVHEGVVPDRRFGKAIMEGSAFPKPQGAAGNRFARSRLGRVLLGFRVGAECEGLSGNLVESGRCAWVFGGDYYAADVGDISLSHVCSI